MQGNDARRRPGKRLIQRPLPGLRTVDESDVVSVPVGELRKMKLDKLLALMAKLGFSTDGITTEQQALTRLIGLAYSSEV